MLKKLAEKMQSMFGRREIFDPATLNDPLALETDWRPAKSGGASFRTHKLVAVQPDRIEFRASLGAKMFYLLFLFIGLGVTIGSVGWRLHSGRFAFDSTTILPLLFGLVFFTAGGCMYYFGTAPVVFDKRTGFFWRGRKAPHAVFDKRTLKNFAELERIHALQLLSEYCGGRKNSYYSYELNLVLKDGARLNVVDHGNKRRLREDADKLSGFLGKPVWDAT
jgi:hypothetical protein